jgi:hypothetical protein
MAELALLIPDSLLLTVPFHDIGIALTALAPVVRVSVPPFTGTVLANLAVFRIGSKFASVGIGAAPPLTVSFAADRLTGLKLGRLEDPLTVATPPFDHTGVVAFRDYGKDLETLLEWIPRPRRWL